MNQTPKDAITTFLRARLDEDEAAAKLVGCESIAAEGYLWGTRYLALQQPDGSVKNTAELDADLAAHIARHDPARVLREVDAKRQIVEAHDGDLFCVHCEHELPCPTLRLLALPHANHPDYREEWRP